MQDLETLIGSIQLPIQIPAAAFANMGKEKLLVDFALAVEQLPKDLAVLVNLNGTSIRSGKGIYQLKLTCPGFLKLTVEDCSIVGLAVVE